jgi:hypothetical protein
VGSLDKRKIPIAKCLFALGLQVASCNSCAQVFLSRLEIMLERSESRKKETTIDAITIGYLCMICALKELNSPEAKESLLSHANQRESIVQSNQPEASELCEIRE